MTLTKEETINELNGLIFFLAFECYSENKEQQKRVEKMGWAVKNAIELLETE